MNPIVTVNPFACRMFRFHDRLDGYLSEESCKPVLDSISRHGQLVPVLGRPLRGDPRHEVELVYGSRRLFSAQLLNRPLKVELREMSDKEAIVAMDIENRHRKDISPYERGLSYLQWLQARQFESQDEIAQALKISAAQVSRLLKLARLPAVVVNAFASPLDICEGWGLELADAWEDVHRRPILSQRARVFSAQPVRPPPREIYRRLLSAPTAGGKVARERDEVVKSGAGVPLFRIRPQQKTIAVLLPRNTLSAHTFEQVRGALLGILQTANEATGASAEERRRKATRPSLALAERDREAV
jgi:ParB family chromosome partitioning protein